MINFLTKMSAKEIKVQEDILNSMLFAPLGCSRVLVSAFIFDFYLVFTARRNARIASKSAELAIAMPSVCLSVRPSVHPSVTPVLCQNDGT